MKRPWPRFAAHELDPANIDTLNNWGESLYHLGRMDEAAQRFEEVLRREPGLSHARVNLGLVWMRRDRPEEAVAEYRRALSDDPDSAATHANLGIALVRLGRRDEALAAFRRSLALRPDDVATLRSAAILVAVTRSFDQAVAAEAVVWAARAAELTERRDPTLLDVLGAALAGARRYAEAATVAEAALRLAVAEGQSQLAEAIEDHLRRYRNGVPLTE